MNINEEKKKIKYDYVKKILNEKIKNKNDYKKALELLKEIGDYKDSKKLIELCNKNLNKEHKTDPILITNISLIFVFLIIMTLIPNFAKERRYKLIDEYYKNGNYDKAYEEATKLGEYKDTKEMLIQITLNNAQKQIENNEYEKAIDTLLPFYKNDTILNLLLKTYYDYGILLYDNKEIYKSISYLEKAKDYKDSSDLIIDMKKEYIDSHNDNKDHILLGFINDLEYTKYKDEANKKLIEIYGFKGTINLADTSGNKIKNTDVPNEYRLILNVTGGRENETGDFNWYEYDKNYNPISLGTHCKLADGESCQTKNKTKNKRNGCYGFAVYYENDELIYKVADIKW